MAVLARLLVLLPMVLSSASAVLAALVLFAGHKQGFMEDYAIARLNTSGIGQNIFDNNTSSSNSSDSGSSIWSDIGSDIESELNKVKNKLESELNDITGDVADDLAKDLGISEWYSIHVMDSCEGMYKPNATAHNPGLNVTNCTSSRQENRFNLTRMLDQELEVGPFDLNLADIKWPSDIQEKLNIINDALYALFILYVIGIVLSGVGALGAIASFFQADRRSLVLLNFVIAVLAALAITIGSIIVTIALSKGVHDINKVGKDVDVHASKGDKFLALTWVASASMIIATGLWVVQFCVAWRVRSKTKHGKAMKEHY